MALITLGETRETIYLFLKTNRESKISPCLCCPNCRVIKYLKKAASTQSIPATKNEWQNLSSAKTNKITKLSNDHNNRNNYTPFIPSGKTKYKASLAKKVT